MTSRAARTHIFLGKCQNPRKHSFCRSWLYRVKSQIYLSHFFLSPIWCIELKSEKIQWKCQSKKQPLLFDCFAAYRAWKEVDNWPWDPFRQRKCGGCFLNWYFEQLSLDLWSEYEMWMRKKWLTKIWWPFLEPLQYSQLLENDPPPILARIWHKWDPAVTCRCESVLMRKLAPARASATESGVAKRPHEISSDQPRRQNSYFLRKMPKSQKT